MNRRDRFAFLFSDVPTFAHNGDGLSALKYATPHRVYGPEEQRRREARKGLLAAQGAELLRREGGQA
jgi:hypothetical protein